jgi:hypothetical protein
VIGIPDLAKGLKRDVDTVGSEAVLDPVHPLIGTVAAHLVGALHMSTPVGDGVLALGRRSGTIHRDWADLRVSGDCRPP